jgi:hypothetical protein
MPTLSWKTTENLYPKEIPMRIKLISIIVLYSVSVLLAGCDNTTSASNSNARTKEQQKAWQKATDTSSPKYSDEVLERNRKPLP